jgi:hypothetical protein
MKKIAVAILTIVYMVVSSGIAMEIHYCMGKKAGVDFFGAKDDKCGKCGMIEKKGGCCSDEHKFVKLEESHKNVYNTIDFTTSEVALVTVHHLYKWQISNTVAASVVSNHSPPAYIGPGTCIMNCVFRI